MELPRLDRSRLHPAMGTRFSEALEAIQQADDRRAADSMLAVVRAAPGPWAYGRYLCFQWYLWALANDEDRRIAAHSDKKALQSFVNSPEEPALFRMQAADSLTLMVANDLEQAVDYSRKVLEVAEQVDPQDLSRPLMTQCSPNSTVGEEVQELVDTAKKMLRCIDNPSDPQNQAVFEELHRLHGDDWTEPQESCRLYLSPELRARYKIGGDACDCCGKTLEELGVARLRCCTRCKKAYYCSVECQRKQWKAGHKAACREPSDIRQGDYMRIEGLDSQPELNGCIVLVKRQNLSKQDLWIVELLGSEKQMFSVATEKLVHLRPVA